VYLALVIFDGVFRGFAKQALGILGVLMLLWVPDLPAAVWDDVGYVFDAVITEFA
jgi:hypothetical protein